MGLSNFLAVLAGRHVALVLRAVVRFWNIRFHLVLRQFAHAFRFLPRIHLLPALIFMTGLVTVQTAEPAAAAPPLHSRIIYLIRHGAYDMGEKGDEQVVNGLTPLGIAQARLTATRLRAIPVTFDSLVSSTLTRARQTAQVIGQSFPELHLQTDLLLCECLPPIDGADLTKEESLADQAAAKAQLDQVFAKYFVPATGQDRHDLIVCHGNVIRSLVMRALGVNPGAWARFNIAHCSLTIIGVSPTGQFTVFAVGDTGHIPPNLKSGLARDNPELVVPPNP